MKRSQRALALFLAVLLAAGMLFPAMPARAAAKKLLALTFDDGPGPYTNRLLDGLKEKNVRATFFALGQRAEMYPDEIRRIVAEGHQLCSHSYDHPELTALGVSGAVDQMTRTEWILNKTVGGSEKYCYRAPYGSMNSAIRSAVDRPEIFWSMDTMDWMSLNADAVRSRLLNECFDGAIVLMHDIHSTTVTGVLSALDSLRDMGYEFVTVRELFRRRGVSLSGGVCYSCCDPTGRDLGPAAAPKVTLRAVDGGTEVTLTTASAGAKIYYTLDGSPIGCGSKAYTKPFLVTKACTIRAVAAYHINGGRGAETVHKYTMPPARVAELAIEDGLLQFSGVPEDETVYYTLDGGDPKTAGLPYGEPAPVEPGVSIAYYTSGKGKIPTGVSRITYSHRGNLFADVGLNAWYYNSMDAAASLGLLSGVGGHRFAPEGQLTRGMVVTILYRMSGESAPEQRVNAFTDVRDGKYYSEAVDWAYLNGVASGVSEKCFKPDRPVTRQELARFAMAYYELRRGAPEFQEETAPGLYDDWDSVAGWARESVENATQLGLMRGNGKGQFAPNATATRCQGAQVLYQLMTLTQ